MRRSDKGVRIILVVLAALIAGAAAVDAQPRRNRVDNRGKEFRIAFLLTNGADDAPNLSLVIAAEKPTSGTITYLRSGRTTPIVIPQGGTPIRIALDTTQLILPDPRNTLVSSRTALLRFDEEVVVYGINTQRWSSDAFLALPVEALGTDHMVLSYPNTLDPTPAAAFTRASDFPSQFAVIATVNGTEVTITPTVRLKGRRDNNPFTVTMNAGDVMFAQADGRAGLDVTGSRITSTRPVVVYGSHQRTNIPWDQAVGRDHLIEQLPSIEKWGRRAIVLPHFQIPKTVDDRNIVRILAARPNTQIAIDSIPYGTLDAGQYFEIPLDRPKLITSNEPILVAQYHHSSVEERFVSQPNDSVGDPFMMLVPAQEQFDSVYWFESFDTKDFIYHFINVVIPSERVRTLTLDGFGIRVPFERIPKTSYSWAQIPVSRGVHRLSAGAPFGLYLYGYGVYNSYGTPGAMVFDTLFKDQKEPSLVWADTCGGVAGYALDDGAFDFGIETMRLYGTSTNVKLEVSPFKPGADSVHFGLPLIDPYHDGQANVVVVDTAGLDRYYSFPVKGFTVALTVDQTTPIMLDTLASLNGREFCRKITLRNYGGFVQRVNALRFAAPVPGVRVTGEFPVDIDPGGTREFNICYQHVGDTVLDVEIQVDNGCQRRSVAILPLISGTDSFTPRFDDVSDPCAGDRSITVSESGVLNSGVADVRFLDSSNVSMTLTPADLPSKLLHINLTRRDPYQDMIYKIEVTDVVGNRSIVADTVGGFTLAVERKNTDQVGIRVDKPWEYPPMTLGTELCDTFYLRNYGLLPLLLQHPRVIGNLEYSIPPDQLPIVLLPGELRPLEICIKPRGVGEQIDTLLIDFNCGTPRELVQLRTVVDPLIGNGVDRCGNNMSFQVNGFVKRNFLQAPQPNPVSSAGKTALVFGLSSAQRISLTIYDGLGNEVRRLFDNDLLPRGLARIDAAVSELPDGLYHVQLRTADGTMLVQKMVVSR